MNALPPTLAFLNLGTTELIVLAILGLLIFGRRLPEVGKSLGKSIVEFKKGLAGIEDETPTPGNSSSHSPGKQLPPDDATRMASHDEHADAKSKPNV